jgi:hypothetical protein
MVRTWEFSLHRSVGHFADGRLAEIFLNCERTSTEIETVARDSAVVASIALQHGATADEIRHALTRDRSGSASGPLGALLDLLAGEGAA